MQTLADILSERDTCSKLGADDRDRTGELSLYCDYPNLATALGFLIVLRDFCGEGDTQCEAA